MPAPLCPAELLALSGADATSFAHAQFTSDVKALAAGDWQWSAWLDAQGRVRSFFALLHPEPSCLLAWLPLGGAEPMREALARFVFRAAVKLETRSWTLHAMERADVPTALQPHEVIAHDGGQLLRQPGTPDRIAWIAPTHASSADPEALSRWRLADIEAGLPLLAPELSGEFVPQALDLESVDAIRFDKGCYPGQEVAARLHFRGGNKRHSQRLRVHGAPPPPGMAILGEAGRAVGQVLYSAAERDGTSAALAVLESTSSSPSSLVTATGSRVELFQ
ncbi:folate-binding protein [Dokdonella soli]|uniref:Folate-binding protein YgfZ n=1 Tax=Dokdonella soli TaxID=529810 RepID=A0ABN1IBJ9_9GAMM